MNIKNLILTGIFLQNLLLIKQTKSIMKKQERFDAALKKLDAATTEIASDLSSLKEEMAAGNVSDESLAKLDANISKLEAMGTEPVAEEPNDPFVENGIEEEIPGENG